MYYLLNHLFITAWSHGDLFYFIRIIIQYYVILLLKLSPCWPLGALPVLPCPFDKAHECGFAWFWFCSPSFFSDTARWSRPFLYISAPVNTISRFAKEPRFLSVENGIRNQDLGARSLCYYWCFVSFRPSLLTEKGNTCMYAKPSIHTYL